MKVVIMCAGNGARWNNYLGIPKQMAILKGEPILYRTIRLLLKKGVPYKNIIVTVREKGMFGKLPCKQVVGKGDPNCNIDKFLTVKADLYLYGDVYYSEKAMDIILSDRNKAWFFGRTSSSFITGKKWGEIFAVKSDDEVFETVKKLKDIEYSGIKRSWEVYRLYVGYELHKDKTGPHWTEINDETDDMDSPEEYLNWKTLHENIISK